VAKQIFDLLFSSIALVVASPLMAICAIAIKISSPGPIIFKQNRVGLNGQLFEMYKFRTMKAALPSESDVRWTTVNDPRRTVVGAILRKTSLDELPQFFNVLRGDMSVVGPRPERPHFAKKYAVEFSRYSSRHRLKVGITGWAQVNGLRGDTSIRKRIRYDLYYMSNWSFWFDLQIIAQTVWAAVIGESAY
jgi:exopolysaccharide biosynthesis polyprenyl glycosylphosphotransferase